MDAAALAEPSGLSPLLPAARQQCLLEPVRR
jgi:hypothetical protein